MKKIIIVIIILLAIFGIYMCVTHISGTIPEEKTISGESVPDSESSDEYVVELEDDEVLEIN